MYKPWWLRETTKEKRSYRAEQRRDYRKGGKGFVRRLAHGAKFGRGKVGRKH